MKLSDSPPPFEEANLFSDNDDLWVGTAPLLPHAVNDPAQGPSTIEPAGVQLKVFDVGYSMMAQVAVLAS